MNYGVKLFSFQDKRNDYGQFSDKKVLMSINFTLKLIDTFCNYTVPLRIMLHLTNISPLTEL